MTRQRASADYNALKTGAKLLVRELGGVDAIAACTRTTRSLASDYGNLGSDRFMPIDVVLDAETIAGRPHVTAALARLQGFALIPIEARAAGDLSVALAEIGRDVAALFADAALALTHGRLTDRERADLLRDLTEVSRVVAEALQLLGTAPPTANEAGADHAV